MAKSYFHDGTDWRELVKGEQGPVGPVGPEGPQGIQGPMGSVELVGDPSITVDTSVGTRVFVGDTMIYGDTGWRDVSDSGWQNGWTGKLHIRRVNNTVEYKFSELAHNGSSSPTMFNRIFNGFQTTLGNLTAPLATNPNGSATGGNLVTSSGSFNSIWRADHHNDRIDGRAAASVIFLSDSSWPRSLPGEPA